MKIIKIVGIFFLIVFTVIPLLLIVSYTNHTKKLKQEAIRYPPLGDLVIVNGKKIHVYLEGEGEPTLVFLAGHGTSNPTLDFQPLWVRMAEDYRIAVVERLGYGWSDTSNSPRDINTILEETRKALDQSGEIGPYVLFPHSMSGLEAIYWAQKYPDEVEAIIGLDPCTPESMDILPETQKFILHAMSFISRIGLSRYMPDSDVEKNFPLMRSEIMTEDDKQKFMAVFYRSSITKDMVKEVDFLKGNARTVAENEVPINTPMYFFISDDQIANVPGWKEALTDYLLMINHGEYLQLDAGHYIHYDQADIIAEKAKAFLGKLN